MKKVIVVSKTHLDLGFTDYAENIRRKYIDAFIPEAIELPKRSTQTQKNISYGQPAPGLSRKRSTTKVAKTN